MPECTKKAPGDVPGRPLRVAFLGLFLVLGSSFLGSFVVSFVGNIVGNFVDEAPDKVPDKVFVTRCDGSWDRKPKCARSGTANGGAGAAGRLQNKAAHAATCAADLGARRMHGQK